MEFCSYFEQIADPPNFLRKLALEFCFRQKSLKLRHSSNWAANLFKIWQNSNASLSVAYLFFIIYQVYSVDKSIVTDTYKPFGKHMHQKHLQKVYSLDRMWDVSSTIPVIFYKVSNCLICHSKDPLIGVHKSL